MRGNLRTAVRAVILLAVIFGAGFLISALFRGESKPDPALLTLKTVPAQAETDPVARDGDAADDAALWVTEDPANSLIIATDKQAGLYVYALDGSERAFLPAGRLNNVDLRAGFEMAGREYVLVAATDRSEKTIALFLLDPQAGGLLRPWGGAVPLDVDDPYGLCLYRPADGPHYVIATGKDGKVRQFAVTAGPGGGVRAERVRSFRLKSIAEGCVADDRTGRLYIAEEERGIWRFGAAPGSGRRGKLIARTDGRMLTGDVEGLALYPVGQRGGWLVASSQGDSTFAVFALPGERLAGRFRIGASADGALDAVTGTDGIEIGTAALPGYPAGILIVQDDEDDSGRQNFKLVDWRAVADALALE